MSEASRKLRAYMEREELSTYKLAAALGVDHSRVVRWLQGKEIPSADVQAQLNPLAGIVNEWIQESRRTGR